jgi:broad specificity phosphatase PhoE
MTAVYVLRHPETTWNLAQRYQGRLESELSEEGKQQAQAAARVFSPGSLDAVVSSPLRRARNLAEAIADRSGAPFLVDHRLTELGQTTWEGLYLGEIRVLYPEMYDRWYLQPDTVRFPYGEDLSDVRARAQSGLSDIFARYPDGDVAVVTHSVVIQVLVATALALDLRHIHRLRITNAGITTLCGTEIPGSVLTLNALDPRSPVAAAAAQGCASWQPRRIAS